MKTFELTKAAKNDLRKIARFTENNWGRVQRLLYLKQLDDTFHLLAETPTLGKACNYIKQGYRKYPQGSHILFYREVSKNHMLIVRILHKHMDIESKFLSL